MPTADTRQGDRALIFTVEEGEIKAPYTRIVEAKRETEWPPRGLAIECERGPERPPRVDAGVTHEFSSPRSRNDNVL